jgi:hypothetical protein
MKLSLKIALFVLFATLNTAVFAQTENDVAFKAKKHSFGTIAKDKPVTISFTFTNNSKKNLIIETATAECGCTTPEFPKEPIKPGKTGIIKVTYNAATAGKFTKKVSVKVMKIDKPIELFIEGEVIAK